jgi:hypothetical protein
MRTLVDAFLLAIFALGLMLWIGPAKADNAKYMMSVEKAQVDYKYAIAECKSIPKAEEKEAILARAAADKAKKLASASKDDAKLKEAADAAEYKASNLGQANCMKRVNGYIAASKQAAKDNYLPNKSP